RRPKMSFLEAHRRGRVLLNEMLLDGPQLAIQYRARLPRLQPTGKGEVDRAAWRYISGPPRIRGRKKDVTQDARHPDVDVAEEPQTVEPAYHDAAHLNGSTVHADTLADRRSGASEQAPSASFTEDGHGRTSGISAFVRAETASRNDGHAEKFE